uniref:Protein HEAT INTOLERANT 4 n=1 Tax=Noccaea caerulescens TaxID=107243 RepID=A0A1J3DNM0_NOCCA
MKKGAKRKGAAKAGRKGAMAENQNDAEEVIAESLVPSTQENGEDAKGDEHENGEKVEVEEEAPTKPDSLTEENQDDEVKDDASPSEEQEEDEKAEEVKEDKKKPGRGGGKRKRVVTNKETEKKDGKKPVVRAKKPRATKPHEEPEYFEEKRNLEDLWKAAFPVGTEWDNVDAVYEFNWDFKHLEEALEEGGMLYGRNVFVFGIAEPQFFLHNGEKTFVQVPTVVVIDTPFPPSDKLAVTSIQSAVEKTISMSEMKMAWVPYIPFDKRDRQVDRMKLPISVLGCTQRKAALKHLKEERVKMFEYIIPYIYQPFKEDELEQSTEVQIMFPSDPPVVCEFDWEFDELEEFVDKKVEDEEISAEQKDEFKEFVKEQVRAAKKANREAREARKKVIEDMSEETKQAIKNMKFYKFYPQNAPDAARNMLKSPFINRYYGNAHQVL